MNRISQTFRTTLPSGEILLSEFRLEHVPIVIANRELYTNLVVLKIIDYDVILGMDFLGKYQATIDCRNRKVIFQPDGEETFEYVDRSKHTPDE